MSDLKQELNSIYTKKRKSGQKAQKKDQKRLAEIDKSLTEIFTLLNEDMAYSAAAIANNQTIEFNVGKANTFLGQLKQGGPLGGKILGKVTQANIDANAAYQDYAVKMDKEGYEVELTQSDCQLYRNEYRVATAFSAMSAGCITMDRPGLGACFLFGVTATGFFGGLANTRLTTLQITLHQKEQAQQSLLNV